jgi:hypothetical protein
VCLVVGGTEPGFQLGGCHSQQTSFCSLYRINKAYESVDCWLLLKSLQPLGLHGWLLGVLKAMYSDEQLQARVGGDEGESFPSTRGVKQGDPVSFFEGVLFL